MCQTTGFDLTYDDNGRFETLTRYEALAATGETTVIWTTPDGIDIDYYEPSDR